MINVIVIRPRISGDRVDFSMKEQLLNPKEANFKKILGEGLAAPKICGCSLRNVWMGHTMKILDADADSRQRSFMKSLPRWTLLGVDVPVFGNAVVYGIKDSEPCSPIIGIRELAGRTTILAK